MSRKRAVDNGEVVKLSTLGKNQVLLDVLKMDDPDVVDGVVLSSEGYMSHKSAKCQDGSGNGNYDVLLEIFERSWAALHSYQTLKDPKNDVILEMGCADMVLYNSFKMNRAYPNYIGIDIRRDYLKASPHKSRKDVIGLCADLSDPLPIKDESISAIVLSEVVEHLTLEQNLVFFKEAYRMLKPGGKVFVGSPVNTEERKFHDLEKEAGLGHIFFWTVEQFEKEMTDIGFSSLDKKWGYSLSSKILVNEIKKNVSPDVAKFIEDISEMYGSSVARAVALSAPNIVNGGCRFTLTK